MKSGNGILFITNGPAYSKEAITSIESIRRFVDLPITVFTTHPLMFHHLNLDYMKRIPFTPKGLAVKPAYMHQAPYQRTLFLDSDTIIAHKDAFEPFNILDQFGIALCHAPARGYNVMKFIPNCVPSWNSGVMFLAMDNLKVKTVLTIYRDRYKRQATKKRTSDQAMISHALWTTTCQVYTLPPEFNCRGAASGVPKKSMLRIIHHREATKLYRINPKVSTWSKNFTSKGRV